MARRWGIDGDELFWEYWRASFSAAAAILLLLGLAYCVLLGLTYWDSKRQPAEKAAAPPDTSCTAQLQELRDQRGELEQELDDLLARLEAAEGRP